MPYKSGSNEWVDDTVAYTPSGNAQTDINSLYDNASGVEGYMGRHLAKAGSAAASMQAQAGNLEQQQTYDPWGYYRPAAAQALAKQSQGANPALEWRNKLTSMMNGSFDSSDPSYQWRFEQGQQALERSQGSRGLLNSGNAAIELQDYGQNQASTEYQAQFERLLAGMQGVESQYDTQQQRLMDLAGVGVGPGVLSNQNLGMFSQVSKNNYLKNESPGAMDAMGGGSKDPYAGYRFG